MNSQQLSKLWLISFVFIITSTFAYSQKVWTLKECVDYALQHNISIRQSAVSAELDQLNYTQNFFNLFPTLNGSVSHNYNFGRSIDPFSNSFTTQQIQSNNLSLSTNVTLFDGFQLQNTLRQSKLNYLAGRYDLQKLSNDISTNVVAAYLQVLYSSDLLIAATNRVEEFTKQRDRTKLMSDAGSVTKSTLLDAEAQLATEDYNSVVAENQLNNAYLNLAQLLELDSVSSIKIAAPETDVSDISILSQTPRSIFIAAQNLPEIKSADTKVMAAEKGLAIARGGRSPRLTMYGSLSSGYSSATQRIAGVQTINELQTTGFTNTGDSVFSYVPSSSYHYEKTPFRDQLDQNYGKSVGLSLNIPLFNGWSANTNIKRAKLNLENSKYSAELVRNQLFKSIQQAFSDALAAQKKYAAAQKSTDAFKESFTYAQKKFDAGLLSSVEFITQRNNLSKAQTDLLQAKYDFIFRIKILDFYSGKPLTL